MRFSEFAQMVNIIDNGKLIVDECFQFYKQRFNNNGNESKINTLKA
jgi:hypothetical protein